MLVGIRRKSRQVEEATELGFIDEVVEGVQLAKLCDARNCVPQMGVGEVLHLGPRGVIDDERGLRRRFRGKEEVRTMAEPCGAASQIFGIHAGVDGVEQGGAIGVGECDQLRRGEFVGFGEHGGGQRNSEECQQKPETSSRAYMTGRFFGFGKEHGRLLGSVLAGPCRTAKGRG